MISLGRSPEPSSRVTFATRNCSRIIQGPDRFELSRWSDETPVTFHLPLKEQEFRFYRYGPQKNVLVLEINEFPETSSLALPGS